jgi:hypothetical protein
MINPGTARTPATLASRSLPASRKRYNICTYLPGRTNVHDALKDIGNSREKRLSLIKHQCFIKKLNGKARYSTVVLTSGVNTPLECSIIFLLLKPQVGKKKPDKVGPLARPDDLFLAPMARIMATLVHVKQHFSRTASLALTPISVLNRQAAQFHPSNSIRCSNACKFIKCPFMCTHHRGYRPGRPAIIIIIISCTCMHAACDDGLLVINTSRLISELYLFLSLWS